MPLYSYDITMFDPKKVEDVFCLQQVLHNMIVSKFTIRIRRTSIARPQLNPKPCQLLPIAIGLSTLCQV